SGRNAIAFGSDNLVAFYQPSAEVPPTGKYRYMPPGVGKPETGVQAVQGQTHGETVLGLQVYPNPSSGMVRLQWRPRSGSATVRITDQLGQIVAQLQFDAIGGVAEWDASLTFGGVYYIELLIGETRESAEVRI